MSALDEYFSEFQLVHVANENVLWFQITVDDIVSVNERERLEDLLEEFRDTRKRKVGGQRRLLVHGAHEVIEILLKKLH